MEVWPFVNLQLILCESEFATISATRTKKEKKRKRNLQQPEHAFWLAISTTEPRMEEFNSMIQAQLISADRESL